MNNNWYSSIAHCLKHKPTRLFAILYDFSVAMCWCGVLMYQCFFACFLCCTLWSTRLSSIYLIAKHWFFAVMHFETNCGYNLQVRDVNVISSSPPRLWCFTTRSEHYSLKSLRFHHFHSNISRYFITLRASLIDRICGGTDWERITPKAEHINDDQGNLNW